MTRSLTAGMITALTAQRYVVAHFLRLEFTSTVIRLVDHYIPGGATIAWTPPGEGSQQWAHFGGRMRFRPIAETADFSAQAVEVELSGVDTTIVPLPSNEHYLNRDLTIWLAALDPVTLAVVATPFLMFRGPMNGGFEYDEDAIDADDPTAVLTVRAVSELQMLLDQNGIRANVSSHQRYFSGDLFFEFVPALRGQGRLYWG